MTEPLDEFQHYLDALGAWAQRAIDRRSEWRNLLEFVEMALQSGSNELRAVIHWREAQMTEQDQKDAAGLLETGFFVGEPEAFRAAAIVTSFELDQHRRTLELFRTLERYRPEHDRAFSQAPDLKDEIRKRKELVSMANLRQDDRGGAFIYESDGLSGAGVEVKLTSLVNPELINFVKTYAPASSSLEIRLDPDYPGPRADPPFATYTPELPAGFLNLLAGVPFGRLLQSKQWPIAPPDGTLTDPRVAAEYFSAGHRTLETAGLSGERSEVYFEELVDHSKVYIDHHDDTLKVQSDGPVLGRMIHCDTNAVPDTPCEEVMLYHLDLAINVYEGAKGVERLTTPLPKRVEATRRIHLFKAAPLPLTLLPGIAYLFFGNRRLLYKSLSDCVQETAEKRVR